ncbi:UNVERIFIED_ORG: hypothetical protein M2193_008874 [Bradyrhizobium japonicum]|uniref:hypothetical protein n=1 Tax=Bradyrhizobium diazoefficiens TaxID=1355477 RepID=UPI00346D60C4
MTGRVRAVRAELYWLDGAHSRALLTVDDDAPSVLMIDGEPFLRADVLRMVPRAGEDAPRYYQVKPHRVDGGLLEGV